MQSFSGRPDSQWDAYAEQLRVKLPEGPPALLDAYVKWAPRLAIIFGIIGLVFLLGFGVLGAVLSPFLALAGMEGITAGFGFMITVALGIVSCVVEIWGGYLMLSRRVMGWWLVALALIVSALSSLLSFSLFVLIIELLIAYVHVMVKPRFAQ